MHSIAQVQLVQTKRRYVVQRMSTMLLNVLLAWTQAYQGPITQPNGDGTVSSGFCVHVDSM